MAKPSKPAASKPTRKPRSKAKTQDAPSTDPFLAMFMRDAFSNAMARQGAGTLNLMNGTEYPIQRITRDYQLMISLYRNSWIIRKVVDLVAQDMLRQWITIQSDIEPEKITEIERVMRFTRTRSKILKGLKLGRLFGGAAGLILIEGQEDELDQPLDLERIMPGDYKGIMIIDRWSGVYPMLELVEDLNSPDFNEPEFYSIRDNADNIQFLVHHSRVLRFIGHALPEWERQTESYWGSSIVEPIFEELKKRDNTSANIAGLVFLAQLRILKMGDLGQALSTTPTASQQQMYNTISAQMALQSTQGIYVMDRDDDFMTTSYTFTGLNDIYQSFMLDMSGATGIPASRLFGRSPAGMNATGESDMLNYYDMLEALQEEHLQPVLDKLLPVVCMSTLGEIPDDLDYIFNPLQVPTELEVADIVKNKTEAILNVHDRGLLSDQTALMELKTIGEGTGIYSNITDEIINKASDEAGLSDLLPPEDDPALIDEA